MEIFVTRESSERTGREHERLTAALAECLRDTLGASTIIQVRERLKGACGASREVDVSARGTVDGEPFFVAIECKDNENEKVGIEVADAFVGKLIDISATCGILVVSSGYTSPALKRAAHAGIQTYMLREANTKELDGRLEIHGTVSARGVEFRDSEIILRDGRVLPASPVSMFTGSDGRTVFFDKIFGAALSRINWRDNVKTEFVLEEPLYRTLDNESHEVAVLVATPRRTSFPLSPFSIRWDALLVRYDADGEIKRDFLSLSDLQRRAKTYET